MKDIKWKYYNHALLPTTAPHEKVDETLITSGALWKQNRGGQTLTYTLDNRF